MTNKEWNPNALLNSWKGREIWPAWAFLHRDGHKTKPFDFFSPEWRAMPSVVWSSTARSLHPSKSPNHGDSSFILPWDLPKIPKLNNIDRAPQKAISVLNIQRRGVGVTPCKAWPNPISHCSDPFGAGSSTGEILQVQLIEGRKEKKPTWETKANRKGQGRGKILHRSAYWRLGGILERAPVAPPFFMQHPRQVGWG